MKKIIQRLVLIYERLYKKKSSVAYNSYLDCLIKLSKIDSAIKLVKMLL